MLRKQGGWFPLSLLVGLIMLPGCTGEEKEIEPEELIAATFASGEYEEAAASM